MLVLTPADRERLVGWRQEIERRLNDLTYPDVDGGAVYEPVRYALGSGGKRLRPLFLLAVYDWLSDPQVLAKRGSGARSAAEGLTPFATREEAWQSALAVEVFHNFTLLHDDLMDQSSLRRGRETVWGRWGDNGAILSGDAMCIYAYEQLQGLSAESLVGVLRRFNDLARGVCIGQQLDMEFEHLVEVPMERYITMVEGKTAALFRGCLALGCYLALGDTAGRGTDFDIEAALLQSAEHLGVAFQLQDDYLDLYGTTDQLGKACGDDLTSEKSTYLSIWAAERADEAMRTKIDRVVHDETISRAEKVAAVRDLYDALGVPAAIEGEIERRLKLAGEHLARAEAMAGTPTPIMHYLYDSLLGRNS